MKSISIVALMLVPALSDAQDNKVNTFGLTIKDAVEVCDPAGERRYLARLICPDGQHPNFHRLGSFDERTPIPKNMSEKEYLRLAVDGLERKALKPGQPDYHITDGYEVSCGNEKVVVYMDMYHCSQPAPTIAPAGFSIIN